MATQESHGQSDLYHELYTTFIHLQSEIEYRRKRIKRNADQLLNYPKRRNPSPAQG